MEVDDIVFITMSLAFLLSRLSQRHVDVKRALRRYHITTQPTVVGFPTFLLFRPNSMSSITRERNMTKSPTDHFVVLSKNLPSATLIRKWLGLPTLAVAFALCGAVAHAQQPKKIPLIGYLSARDAASESSRDETIRLALRERGYIEGQNIAIEYRYAEGKVNRLPELVAELVRLKVDVIVVAGGTPDIRAAKNATKTIPIVMTGPGGDPVEAGHVESLARPGGNVTGVTLLTRNLSGKRLELLKEAVPKLAHVAVLYDPAVSSTGRLQVKDDLPVVARALRLTLQPWEVRVADDFERVFAALNKQRPDGIYVLGGPLLNANGKRIADLALKSRLPSMYNDRACCRCRWAPVLRGGPSGHLPARRIFRGQNPEGSQACRSAGGAADEVRAGDQSENGKADRP